MTFSLSCMCRDSHMRTGPEAGWAIRVWEEVVGLERPGHVVRVLGRRVACRRGVEHVDTAVQVGVMDQLVQVFEPGGLQQPHISCSN